MSEVPKHGVFRLVVPGFLVMGLGALVLHASGGTTIECTHGPDGTACVVSRRLFGRVDVPLRYVSNVQGVKMGTRHATDMDGRRDYELSHPYLVTPRGEVSMLPPGDSEFDSSMVSGVEQFCQNKSAPPLSLRSPTRSRALHVLGAVMVLWAASLVLQGLKAAVTGRPSKG